MIEFKCPHCRNDIRVTDDAAGKRGTCKKCGHAVLVPGHDQPLIINQNATPVPITPQPYIDTRPPVAIQVNQSPQAANSMGIASMVLGIVALMLCWLPLINQLSMIIGGVGLLLAFVGFFLGTSRRGSGLGYPIAGGLLSGLAVCISFMVWNAINEAFNNFGQGENVAETVQEVFHNDVKNNKTNQAKWRKAGNKAIAGDAIVEISYGDIGPIKTKNFGDEPTESDEEYLKIGLKVNNRSDTKKHNYVTWGWQFDLDRPILTDEFGNTYRILGSTNSTKIVGQTQSKELYPGDSIDDLLVFEKPVSKAKKLKLELPGKSLTNNEPLYFKFYTP